MLDRMEKKEITPLKNRILNTNIGSSMKQSPQKLLNSFQINYIKQFESLKIQNKNLQKHNKQLSIQVDRLKQQKYNNEQKYISKINFEQETLLQYKKEKNYQLDLIQLKTEQQINRCRRQKDKQIQNILRQLKAKQSQCRQKNVKIQELKKDIVLLHKQITLNKDNYKDINDRFSRLQIAQRNAQIVNKNMELQNIQMRKQIQLLLQIEAEKTIKNQQLLRQIQIFTENQIKLTEKLKLYTNDFLRLEKYISSFKSKLKIAQNHQIDLQNLLQNINNQLDIRQSQIQKILITNQSLLSSKQEAQRRQKARQTQVEQLIVQNQRLFNQLNLTRHKLHDIIINHKFN